jgi:hypothetical protein
MTHGGLPPAVHELADVEPNILVLIRVWLLRDEAKMPAPDGQDSFLIKVAKPIIAVERRVAMLNLPGLLACDRTVTVPKDRAEGRITPKRSVHPSPRSSPLDGEDRAEREVGQPSWTKLGCGPW